MATRKSKHEYLDNQSVIQRIQSAIQQGHVAPNTELLPEHDVIKEIAATIPQLPWTIELKWVKGHQDSRVPYHQLPLEAQLNCQADAEANLYDPEANPLLPPLPLPSTPCQLYVQGQTITRAMKRRITYAAVTPSYYKYLCQRFERSAGVIYTIDWDTYTNLLKRHGDIWPTVVKHLHDLLSPTGHVAHKDNPSLPHNCPACQLPYEDNPHVLKCPAHSRAQWRSHLLAQPRKWDNSRSDPILIDILHDGIRSYFLSTPLLPDRYPAEYHGVIRTQNILGWNQLFKARWSKQWAIQQNAHRDKYPTSTTLVEGNRWVVQLGHMLVESWLDLWQMRNAERHGQDKAHQEAFKLQVITAELNKLYNLKHSVCPSDRHLFYTNAAEHLQRHQNLSQIEEWIHLYRDAIRASAKTAKALLGIQQTRTLLDYPMFNPAILPGQQALVPGCIVAIHLSQFYLYYIK